MTYKNAFSIDATLVANEFLDRYMPQANGDYVKVYLYLLKNGYRGIDVQAAAEKLNLTEGDITRAVRYWEKQGILSIGEGAADPGEAEKKEDAARPSRAAYASKEAGNVYRDLSGDEEFAQLLFIAQKYLAKQLGEKDQQVLAYLYDGLHLPAEVIDYLIDYSVQHGHRSLRYIEKVGLDWAERGFRSAAECRDYVREFEQKAAPAARRNTVRREKKGIVRNTDFDSAVLEDLVGRLG